MLRVRVSGFKQTPAMETDTPSSPMKENTAVSSNSHTPTGAVAKSAYTNNNDIVIETPQTGRVRKPSEKGKQYQIEQQEGQKKEEEHENDDTCKKCGEKGGERILCCSV